MNWLKKALIIRFTFLSLTGCGVKGDPLPPEKPADLGRGRPTYKRAIKDIKRADEEDQKSGTDKDLSKDQAEPAEGSHDEQK